jgi:DNA polymerase-3 subunit delta'
LANNSLKHTNQGKKTIVIENAEKMTTSAANALLKTLEEPSDNSLIILLTSDIDSLLPTIISRCRIINIKPENSEEFSEAKKNRDPFANASQWAELNDEIIREQYTDFLTKLVNYLRLQQDFDNIVTLLVNNQYAYRWFEKIITNIMRQQQQWVIAPLALSAANICWLQQINTQTLWQIYQLLLQTNKQLKLLPQANKQFIIEKLLINCLSLLNKN